MSDTSYSATLLRLSNVYSHNHMSFEECRMQIKIILDKIDEEFNGGKSPDLSVDESGQLSRSMNTIAFFKGTMLIADYLWHTVIVIFECRIIRYLK